jgi:hypothetical protein
MGELIDDGIEIVNAGYFECAQAAEGSSLGH